MNAYQTFGLEAHDIHGTNSMVVWFSQNVTFTCVRKFPNELLLSSIGYHTRARSTVPIYMSDISLAKICRSGLTDGTNTVTRFSFQNRNCTGNLFIIGAGRVSLSQRVFVLLLCSWSIGSYRCAYMAWANVQRQCHHYFRSRDSMAV